MNSANSQNPLARRADRAADAFEIFHPPNALVISRHDDSSASTTLEVSCRLATDLWVMADDDDVIRDRHFDHPFRVHAISVRPFGVQIKLQCSRT